jgi:hypothetical protein
MPELRTIGWLLDQRDRETLLAHFTPAWPDMIAHHVTLASKSTDPLPIETAGQVVGQVNDGEGLQALVVAIGGTTDRPDGSTYHITWSLDKARGREAKQSNDVLRERGFDRLDAPIPIRLMPSELS